MQPDKNDLPRLLSQAIRKEPNRRFLRNLPDFRSEPGVTDTMRDLLRRLDSVEHTNVRERQARSA